MKLYDLIHKTHRLYIPRIIDPDLAHIWKERAKLAQNMLYAPDVVKVNIDNVAEYFYKGSDQKYWDFRYHFPNLAPPWRTAWYEYALPKLIRSKELGNTEVPVIGGGRAGILMCAVKASELSPATQSEWLQFEDGRTAEWLLMSELFIYYGIQRDMVEGPHGTIVLAVDKDGSILEQPRILSMAADEDREVLQHYISWTHPAFLAMSFLHCKNVTVEDTPISPKLAKRFKERNGFEPAVCKQLVIEPLKQILRHEGKSQETGLAKAMHICRGHFADYTEGRGLFGKYHGRYWMPQTVKGGKAGDKAVPKEVKVKI